MPSKNNRKCKVCGEKYSYCPTCQDVSADERFKIMFCSKNCRDIFHTLSRYGVKTIDKSTANEILSSLDLSKQSQFADKIKSDIADIMKQNKKNKKKAKHEEFVAVEPTVCEEQEVASNNQVEINIEPVAEPVIEENQYSSPVFFGLTEC